MIYFAQADVSGQIKIGFHGGTDANDRLRELQTGCPTKLFLLGTLPGGPETESDLHKQFAFAHAHGEWFKPVPELLAFIGQQPAGPKLNGTAVESRFVQIKILTVGRKSFTEALFKQLPSMDIVDWDMCSPHAPLVEQGEAWGWIQRPENCGPSRYLIWQGERALFKCHLLQRFDSCLTKEGRAALHKCKHFLTKEEQREIAAQYLTAWKDAQTRWRGLDQLFIGV